VFPIAERNGYVADPVGQIVLLGKSGILGSAVLANCHGSAEGLPATILPDARKLLRQLLDGDSEGIDELCRRSTKPQVWIFAVGITDPSRPEDELMRVNVEAPIQLHSALCRAVAQGAQVRFATFGSVLEERSEIAAGNPYIRSKARLKDVWHEQALASGVPWTHYQLHTLYGRRRPHPYMFLGQMEAALRQKIPFHMSSGDQLREYQHADDVAVNVLHHLRTAAPRSDKVAVNSGCATRLRDLAEAIFRHFGRLDLLKVGALAPQRGEVFESRCTRSEYVVASRDPIHGVIAWLEELGISSAAA
jgi:nucleoside-diphosphate-sugar epimerase